MNEWIVGTSMDQVRVGAASAVIGDILYCSGGMGTPGNTVVGDVSTMELYDTSTDLWRKVEMPGALSYHAMVEWKGLLYFIGGVSGSAVSNQVWIYDPAADTWDEGEDMPSGVYAFSAEHVDGRIYCFGGRTVNTHNAGSNLLQIYDPAADRWEPQTMEETFCFTASAVVDKKIYLFGGWNGTGQNDAQDKVRVYDPATGTWTEGDPMDTPRYILAVTADGSRVYVMGGAVVNSVNGSVDYFAAYDTITDSWSSMDSTIPVAVYGACAEYHKGRIYLCGGRKESFLSNRLDIYLLGESSRITCRYQDEGGNDLLPETVTEAVVGDSFTAQAPAVSGYAFVESRVDSGQATPDRVVAISQVTGNHTITFVYRPDGGTHPPGGGGNHCCCCCCSMMLEMLRELRKIVQIASCCDGACGASETETGKS